MDFRIAMNDTSNTATNFYRVRPFADIQTGSADATDANLNNNRSNSENYAFFNNNNAG
ncbi:hypothetical protein [Nocardioides jishulii]|uniref:hypothetical protein n=1 Tax=Nocardioides jishulii TaxID=2575440 RepID=UPI00148556E7|nr:hypothetical protein [Nocardioides jishulii]